MSRDSLEVVDNHLHVDEPTFTAVKVNKAAAVAFLPFLRHFYKYKGDGTDISVALDYDNKTSNVRSIKNILNFICVRKYEDGKALSSNCL